MNFLDKWLSIIRNCSYDNTYKMAWAKAITEIAIESDFSEEQSTIHFREIAKKVIKYYWEQTIFFNLQQSPNPLKPPAIVSTVKGLIKDYQEKTGSLQPVKYLKSNLETICQNQYERAVKRTVADLKKDVSHRFIKLSGAAIEGVYEYELGSDYLTIPSANLKQLKDNSIVVFELINYRWAQMLEGFNHSPKICKKVRIIEEDEIPRKPLGKFSKYLDVENGNHICFICNKVIDSNETPSIDHVVPWSYLYSDDLWNLVYAHRSCNSSKSNVIPSESVIIDLEARNLRLLNGIRASGLKEDKHISELEFAIQNNLVRKFWISCQG
ncbi:HNH endonuclease domain-containing protein [Paenibacillus rigui]|uniref:HNH endonuclease n=1 Tax=Paenibacillus rigui TaxID=554312 RepID=A0A229URI5_9BACL|nr:HNH endonuclease domain-containing protein [Paenibacillus rigui]OXM85805.1 HNH endonuclease [Paenibacillus rigui]